MISRSFSFRIGLRLGVLFLLMAGLAYSLVQNLPFLISLLLGIFIILQAWGILRFVNRTNQELVNFITGLRFNDYMQTFTLRHLGGTFRDLEEAMNLTVKKVKELRSEKEQQAAYFKALVEHIPLPLFFIFPDDRVEVLNNATRRAFNVADFTNIEELNAFGAEFARDVRQIQPGDSVLTTIHVEGAENQFIVSATQINMAGKIQKLISMQNVQSQLDATELATWQNLLRVTSHEILNSLSPVSSLARTIKGLVDDHIKTRKLKVSEKEDLKDISDGLNTLVNRSEGLTNFVQSYRQLTRMPPPKKKDIKLSEYFKHLKSLVQADWQKRKIKLEFVVDPENLTLKADEGMLDQALINLLRNAADALKGRKNPRIKVRAYFNTRNQVVIEVEDNGPGIDRDKKDQIFVPFFTTKKGGSGVGLPLVRYIVLSHGGSVSYQPANKKGSIFRLAF